MAHLAKSTSAHSDRRFVLADNLRMKPIHPVVKTESSFGGETPATRTDTLDSGMIADPELQSSIKAAVAALND